MSGSDSLDDEDYALIEENVGVKWKKQKYKRLRICDDSESDNEEDNQRNRDKIAVELFGVADLDTESPSALSQKIGEDETSHMNVSYDDESSDSNEDFIDDDGWVYQDKNQFSVSNLALIEAKKIFGSDFNTEEFEVYQNIERHPRKGTRLPDTTMSTRRFELVPFYELYEPYELEQAGLTFENSRIVDGNVPERIQNRITPLSPANGKELEEETEWIYKIGFSDKKPSIKLNIRSVLELLRNYQLDIPFIAFHRKELTQTDLNINNLWKIFKLDERFCNLKTRKNRNLVLLKKLQKYLSDPINEENPQIYDMRQVTDADMKYVESIQTELELTDINLFVRLFYSKIICEIKEQLKPSQVDMEEGEILDSGLKQNLPRPLKRRTGNNTYDLYAKLGLKAFILKFGLTAKDFAEALQLNHKCQKIVDVSTEPLEAAKEYVSVRLPKAEDVLMAAKIMLATEITFQPIIRRCVRQEIFKFAKVSVQATKKGMQAIDEFHPCFSMKYIEDKPVSAFSGDEFLRLSLAEEDGYIEIFISKNLERGPSNYIDDVKLLFHQEHLTEAGIKWNSFLCDTIQYAFEKLLFPVLEKELRSKLLDEAKSHVLKSCSEKLYKWLKVAPYKMEQQNPITNDVMEEKMRVLALSYSKDVRQASYAVIVSENGFVGDHLELHDLVWPRKFELTSKSKNKGAAILLLKEFILTNRPILIIISGDSRDAIQLAENVRHIVDDANKHGFSKIKVEICDNQLAKTYANSKISAEDFPNYPSLLKEAISLGRRLLDPLLEFSRLCNSDEEILNLRLHELQDHVPKKELLEQLYLEFQKRTNDVGVDLNKASKFSYCSNVVQFVGGLGPKKAKSLIKFIKENGSLETREQLMTKFHMGPTVFVNCAAFVKIEHQYAKEILDSTRIHPENYSWARRLAAEIVEIKDEEIAAKRVFKIAQKVAKFSMAKFECKAGSEGFKNKFFTLKDMQKEFCNPFGENRIPYQSLTPKELFYLLSKETPETLNVGKFVTPKFTKYIYEPMDDQEMEKISAIQTGTGKLVCPLCGHVFPDFQDLTDIDTNHFKNKNCSKAVKIVGAQVYLDNGVAGFISADKLETHLKDPTVGLKPGQIVNCRIISIKESRFLVNCSALLTDLRDKEGIWRPAKDMHYNRKKDILDKKKELTRILHKKKTAYLNRRVVHSSYKNVTQVEAERILQSSEQGSAIVRPSSTGFNHLKLTWKVTMNIYQHVTIVESVEGKIGPDGLRSSLIIGTEPYVSLDEIFEKHIHPMSSNARDIIDFKYYQSQIAENLKEAEKYLQNQFLENNRNLPYIFHPSKKHPGKFIISYLSKTENDFKTFHEFVAVTPDGFHYRQKFFKRLTDVINYHKTHKKPHKLK